MLTKQHGDAIARIEKKHGVRMRVEVKTLTGVYKDRSYFGVTVKGLVGYTGCIFNENDLDSTLSLIEAALNTKDYIQGR